MLDTWDQRVRRDGIVVNEDLVPGAADRRWTSWPIGCSRAITPATKVLHFCHITNLTGQIFPGARHLRGWRARRGIQTIVDGAHAFAHFPFKVSRPRVRLLRHQPAQVAARAGRHRLPLRAPREHRQALAADAGQRRRKATTSASSRRSARIRRRTTTRSPRRSRFHEGIGVERKAARLRYLRDRWANAARRRSPESGSTPASIRRSRARSERADQRRADRQGGRRACGTAGGSSPRRSCTPSIEGVRVTPNVYTTLEEVDTFAGGDGRDRHERRGVSAPLRAGSNRATSPDCPRRRRSRADPSSSRISVIFVASPTATICSRAGSQYFCAAACACAAVTARDARRIRVPVVGRQAVQPVVDVVAEHLLRVLESTARSCATMARLASASSSAGTGLSRSSRDLREQIGQRRLGDVGPDATSTPSTSRDTASPRSRCRCRRCSPSPRAGAGTAGPSCRRARGSRRSAPRNPDRCASSTASPTNSVVCTEPGRAIR